MPRRPCLDCGQLANGTRCTECTAARQRTTDARRGTHTARGYDAAWQVLVTQAIDAHPWCTDCGIGRRQAVQANNPLTGDHLRWPAESLDDVEVCCRRCNSKRGARRRR